MNSKKINELKEEYKKKKENNFEEKDENLLLINPKSTNLAKSQMSIPDISESQNQTHVSNQLTNQKSIILQEFINNHPFEQTPNVPYVDVSMIKDLGKVSKIQQNNSNNKIYSVSYANGTKYEGCIIEDKDDIFYGQPYGEGKLWFPNGDIYEGELGNRVKGKYYHQNGTIYEGTFFKYSKSGVGVETYPNGSIYKGAFLSNLKHGVGELIFNNKDSYKGKFKMGLRNGLGTYIFASGESIYGDWKNDQLNGKGKWKGLSGEKVERKFVNSHVFD